MAEIKTDDSWTAMRAEQDAPIQSRVEALFSRDESVTDEATAASIRQLKEALATALSAQDKLPPVISDRSGLLARLELWLKGFSKRATRWYTWEQVNFNVAVQHALDNVLTALTAHERRLDEMQARTPDGASSDEALANRLANTEARLASLETFVENELDRLRDELRERLELLMDEQRVAFKQLALEIKEMGANHSRSERESNMRLNEMIERLENLRAAQSEIEQLQQSLVVHQGQP